MKCDEARELIEAGHSRHMGYRSHVQSQRDGYLDAETCELTFLVENHIKSCLPCRDVLIAACWKKWRKRPDPVQLLLTAVTVRSLRTLDPLVLASDADERPVTRVANTILQQAVKTDAHEIWIEICKRQFEKVVEENGFANERDMAEAKAQGLGLFFVDLTRHAPEVGAVDLVPESIARRHNVIPVKRDSNTSTLYVATSDPMNPYATNDLRIVTGCNIHTVIATPSAIQAAIARVYGGSNAALSIARGGTFEQDTVLSETKIIVQYLIGSDWHEVMHMPTYIDFSLRARFKTMALLKVTKSGIPQEGNIPIIYEGKDYDVHLTCKPQPLGESLHLRIARVDRKAA